MNWLLDRYSAVGSCSGRDGEVLELQVDASRPTPGVVQAKWSGELLAGFWQGISGNLFESPPTIEEMYVRGSDLVCRYGEHPGSMLTSTVYWQMQTSAITGVPWIETRLAVQTSTLGTQPQVDINWHFPHGPHSEFGLSETLIDRLLSTHDQPLSFLDRHRAESFRLERAHLPAADVYLIPLVHLSDYQSQTFSTDSEAAEIRQTLQLELLEKGVIRTARVRCLVCRQSLDDTQILQEAVSFFESELPLTT